MKVILIKRPLLLYLFLFGFFAFSFHLLEPTGKTDRPLKIYWFIPDGLRAETEVFKIEEWARQGELPNLKRMLEEGAFGYSKPVFPSHTPVNFATLMTGFSPRVHGVSDGAMRRPGYPLKMVVQGGFSSTAKRVPSIWTLFENQDHNVSLLSVPGSTPPELNRGQTIRGRWGSWGVELPAIIFHSDRDLQLKEEMGVNRRVFTYGSELTRFVSLRTPESWALPLPKSFSPLLEVNLHNWGLDLWALLGDSADDGRVSYDRLWLSLDKSSFLAELKVGESSSWIPAQVEWETKNDYNEQTPKKSTLERELSKIRIATSMRIRLIEMGDPSQFRLRILYDSNNLYSVQPTQLSERMRQRLGPMVDHVDNYPPQLIYRNADKETFLEEMELSFKWHESAVSFLVNDLQSEVVIHSLYSPNQMLTSRWWLPYLDPRSPLYKDLDETQRERLWGEVKAMYKAVDRILGQILDQRDPSTYVVLSSDHGALPLWKEVRLNNLFAQKGWLKTRQGAEGLEVDWERSQVVFLQMNHIYINPDGLGGPFARAQGSRYEALRREVSELLRQLQDSENQQSPVSGVWTAEAAPEELDLPLDRVGDLIVGNRPPYLWAEDLSRDGQIFVRTKKGGYKQGVDANDPGLLTPFAIIGPRIKKGARLSEVIRHQDQPATILSLFGVPSSQPLPGRVLTEIIEGNP